MSDEIKNPTTPSSDDGGLDLDLDLSGVEVVEETERSADEIDKDLGVHDNFDESDIPIAGDDDDIDEDDAKAKKKLKKKKLSFKDPVASKYEPYNQEYRQDPVVPVNQPYPEQYQNNAPYPEQNQQSTYTPTMQEQDIPAAGTTSSYLDKALDNVGIHTNENPYEMDYQARSTAYDIPGLNPEQNNNANPSAPVFDGGISAPMQDNAGYNDSQDKYANQSMPASDSSNNIPAQDNNAGYNIPQGNVSDYKALQDGAQNLNTLQENVPVSTMPQGNNASYGNEPIPNTLQGNNNMPAQDNAQNYNIPQSNEPASNMSQGSNNMPANENYANTTSGQNIEPANVDAPKHEQSSPQANVNQEQSGTKTYLDKAAENTGIYTREDVVNTASSDIRQSFNRPYTNYPENTTTVDNKTINGANASFGGGTYENFSSQNPFTAPNPANPSKIVPNEAVKAPNGTEVAGEYNQDYFAGAAGTHAAQDVRRSITASELPEGTYVGARVIPTPAGSTMNTYNDPHVAQPSGPSLSPKTSDIGHVNPVSKGDMGSVLDEKKYENTSLNAGNKPLNYNNNVTPSTSPLDNGSFHTGQMDKRAPLQNGTGNPTVVTGGGVIRASHNDVNSVSFLHNQTNTPNESSMGGTWREASPISSGGGSNNPPSGPNTPKKEPVGSSVIDKNNKDDDVKVAGGKTPSPLAPKKSDNAQDTKSEEKKEKRTLEKDTVLKYTQKGDLLSPLEAPGRAAISPIKEAFKDDKDDDKSTSDNKHDIRVIKTIGKDAASLYKGLTNVLGLDAAASMSATHADKIAEVATKIKTSDVSLSLLSGDKKSVKNALKDNKNFTRAEKRFIARNREYIHDKIATESEIKSMFESGKGGIKASEAKIIESGHILNNRFADEYHAALDKCFKQSDNPLLKNLDIMKMNHKQLKRFYNKNKNHLSVREQRLVRGRLGDLKGIEARPKKFSLKKAWKNRKSIAKGLAGKVLNYVSLVQDPTFQAVSKVRHYIGVGLAAKNLLAFYGNESLKFIGRTLSKTTRGRAFLEAKAEKRTAKAVKKAQKQARKAAEKAAHKEAVKSAVKNSKVSKKLGDIHKNAIGGLKSTPIAQKGAAGVQAVQHGLQTANTAITTAGQKVAGSAVGKGAKAVGKAVGKGVKTTAKVVTAPVKAVNTVVTKVADAFKALAKKLLIFVAIFILIYMAAVLLLGLFAMFSSIGKGAFEIDSTLILAEPEDVKEWIDTLNEKDKEKYEEAMEIAMGTPISQDVYYDQKIYHYGSPQSNEDEEVELARMYHNYVPDSETTNGYHIYYLDSAGRVVGQDTTNVKDIISMSAVMFNNDFYKDEKFEEYYKDELMALMNKWYELLNPEIYYVESDIYHTEFSTDRFPFEGETDIGKIYYCTDEAFYDEYERAVADGVEFYEEPHEYTEKGCETDWDAYNEALDSWREDEPDLDDYWEPYEGMTFTPEEWDEVNDEISDEYDSDWEDWRDAEPDTEDYKYCPGHGSEFYDMRYIDPELGVTPGLKCSYGYRDINIYVTVLNKEDVYDAVNDGTNIIKYVVPADYECTEWIEKEVDITIPATEAESLYEDLTKKFYESDGWMDKDDLLESPEEGQIDNIDWCNNLYDQDWFGLYGVDVYSYSVSLSDGSGTLTEEQIAEYLGGADVDERRMSFVQYALGAVGQIPYYWGGKAEHQGYDGNDFGRLIKADYKGRNRKGLDCSGFVGWVYWTLFDVKPAAGTANLTNSLHLERISFDQLKPGDLGLQALPGATSNHIGIFVGFDEETGRAIWVHENSGDSNVGVNNTNCFKFYYKFR